MSLAGAYSYRKEGPWRHLDGTECVAGFSEQSAECASGSGLVMHKAVLVRFNQALTFVQHTARQKCQCEQPALPVTGGPPCASCDAKLLLTELGIQ